MNNFIITKLSDSNINYVNSVIQSNKLIYGDNPLINEMKEYQFYEIKEQNKLLGFFAIGNYLIDNHELVIAYVFIKKQFRRQGCFNKIVEYGKNKAKQVNEDVLLDINASITNDLANSIYKRKFKSMGKDRLISGELVNWYNIYSSIPDKDLDRLIFQFNQNKINL